MPKTRFSLEDVFDDGTPTGKLAWVNGWRKLPHIDREVQRLYDYPQQFAKTFTAASGASSGGAIQIPRHATAQEPGACISCPGTTLRLIRRRRRFRKCRPGTSALRTGRLWRRTRLSHMTGATAGGPAGRAFPCQLRNAKRMDCPQEGPAHGGPWCGPRCQDCRAAARRRLRCCGSCARSDDTENVADQARVPPSIEKPDL